MRRRIDSLVIALAAFIAAGCTAATDTKAPTVVGVPQLLIDGAPAESVDFGAVAVGMRVEREVIIRNIGMGALTLTGVAPSADLPAAFAYPREIVTLNPGEEIPFRMSFAPSEVGTVSGSLTLSFANAPAQLLSLRGEGATSHCALSTRELDFGFVAIGFANARDLVVLNSDPFAWQVTFDSPATNDGSGGYAFAAGFDAGTHTVPAASADGHPGELHVPLEFAPILLGLYNVQLTIHSQSCPSSVTLEGVGIEHALECTPISLVDGVERCRVDFGYVQPGTKIVRTVTLRNLGIDDVAVALSPVADLGAGPFSLESAASRLVVPGSGGEVSIDVAFAPTEAGGQSAELAFTIAGAGQPAGTVQLVGIGGGPRIEVQPGQIDFGRIAIDTRMSALLTFANTGLDIAGTADDNLVLAVFEHGTFRARQPEIVGADAADFALEWPPIGYNDIGLSEGQNAQLRVKFTPHTLGSKAATLVIYSNDPNAPQLHVPLAGFSLDLLPCDFVVKPASLNFGIAAPEKPLTLSFSIVNRDTDPTHECLVAALNLTGVGNPEAFALAEGAIASATIRGGEALRVPVTFRPAATGSYTGEIKFLVSNPTTPEVTVQLSGTAQSSCLVISPREPDFGTIGANCKSRQLTVTVQNGCATSQTITALDLPTSEFTITKKSVLPWGVPVNGSVEIGITYQPTAVGQDAAALSMRMNGMTNPYVIPLRGRAAIDPIQTEVFATTGQLKVDVVMIIDNSCSMSDKQASMARNLMSFLSPATRLNVDYHIGVTTVSVDSASYECGRFIPVTNSSPRVITPSTPNLASVFGQNVQRGDGGTGTESLIRPAYLALSPPLISGHNAGFYRDEAKLAIVVLSDAADQDPLSMPVSFYENFLFNLKGINRRNDITYSGIIPLMSTEPPYSSGCSYDSSDAGQDPRARKIIEDTGGIAEEICDPDYSKVMQHIGSRVFGLRTRYFLLNAPDMAVQDPLVITVDGQPYPQYDARGDKRWEYNPSLNSVEFDPIAAPDYTQTLTISYHVACLH